MSFLLSRIHGLSEEARVEEEMKTANIVAGFKALINDYNSKVEAANIEIDLNNSQVKEMEEKGELNAEEALRDKVLRKNRAHGKINGRSVRRWEKKRFRWVDRNVGMLGNFLPYEHPHMARVRDEVRDLVASKKVHPCLVLNFRSAVAAAPPWAKEEIMEAQRSKRINEVGQ